MTIVPRSQVARTALLCVGGVLLGGAVATGVASYTFVAGMGLRASYPTPSYEWWLYALNTPPDWPAAARAAIQKWLKVSGSAGIASVIVPILAYASRKPTVKVKRPFWQKHKIRDIVRGTSDNHGHAEWLSEKRSAEVFPGPNDTYGGLVVGENYRVDKDKVSQRMFNPRDPKTWGMGGKAPLLIDPCETGPTHSIIFSGPGGYKTVSAISSLLYWKGAAIVMDPSAELGPMLREEKKRSGHRVVELAPGGPEGFNVLEWIDIQNPLAETNVHAVVGWSFGETPGSKETSSEQFFRDEGKKLAACLLAHLLWDPEAPAHMKTLATWKQGLSTPQEDLRDLLRRVHNSSHSLMARKMAGELYQIVPETFSGIYANANNGTRWLGIASYANMLSRSTFNAKSVLTGQITVFLQIPMKTLQETPGVARTVIGALLNQVYEAEGKLHGRVLFLLDEVFQLGYMKVLTIARDVGRKYGITLQLIYQSVAQADAQWTKEGRRAWYDAVSWRAYGSIQDRDTAREVSEDCGTYAVVATSEGNNAGSSGKAFEAGNRSKGSNASYHEIKRALILPQELTQDVRGDEVFVFARGCKPIRCGRAIYFRRPEMKGRIQESRYITNMKATEHV